MQLKTSEARSLLERLGFTQKKCSHHYRAVFYLDGVPILSAFVSNGRKDMPGSIPDRFRRSLYLTEDEFEALRKKHLDRDGYIMLLRRKGIIE